MAIDSVSIGCVHCLDARAAIAVLPISDKTMAPSNVLQCLINLSRKVLTAFNILYKVEVTHSDRKNEAIRD